MIRKWIVLIAVFWALGAAGIQAAQASPAEKPPVFSKEDDFLAAVHRHFMNRDREFTVAADENIGLLYGDDSEYLLSEVFEMEETKSDDFDYLRYHVQESAVTAQQAEKKVYYRFKAAYYDTLPRAEKVNQAVKKALKNLSLKGEPEEVKAVRIHDYIVKNGSPYLGQGRQSAYDALKKSASSRGYALLTYKMMREAGVPCRIVMGKMGNEAHAWNMVKLDGSWYYMDNAADAAAVSPLVPVRYTYFLVGANVLVRNHQLADEYQTVDFESRHPISREDYSGRDKLILASDAARAKEKTGVGAFNEMYDRVSNVVVDPIERLNDRISNSLLDRLAGVFGGA